jgi:hypothetical protein
MAGNVAIIGGLFCPQVSNVMPPENREKELVLLAQLAQNRLSALNKIDPLPLDTIDPVVQTEPQGVDPLALDTIHLVVRTEPQGTVWQGIFQKCKKFGSWLWDLVKCCVSMIFDSILEIIKRLTDEQRTQLISFVADLHFRHHHQHQQHQHHD